MRLPNEPTSKGLCNKMQTAEQFITWYLDEQSSYACEINFAEVEEKLYSLSQKEQDRLRTALKARQTAVQD